MRSARHTRLKYSILFLITNTLFSLTRVRDWKSVEEINVICAHEKVVAFLFIHSQEEEMVIEDNEYDGDTKE